MLTLNFRLHKLRTQGALWVIHEYHQHYILLALMQVPTEIKHCAKGTHSLIFITMKVIAFYAQ